MRDPEDKRQFSELIAVLAAAFSKEAGRLLLEAYWKGLRDCDLADVERAVERAIRIGGQFMPTPSTLREMSGEQSMAMRVLLAWDAVRKAISNHGVWKTVVFSDPAVTAAIRLAWGTMGWVELCNRKPGDAFQTWAKKDFEAAYVALVTEGVREDQARPLPGLFALQDRPTEDAVRPRLVRIEGVEPARLLGARERKQLTQPAKMVANTIESLAKSKALG